MSVRSNNGKWEVIHNETGVILGSFASRSQARDNNARLQTQASAPSTTKTAPAPRVAPAKPAQEVVAITSVVLNATVIVIPENATQASIVEAFEKVSKEVDAEFPCPATIEYSEQEVTPTGKTIKDLPGGGGARVKIRRHGEGWDIFRNDVYLATATKVVARIIMHYLTDTKTDRIPSYYETYQR